MHELGIVFHIIRTVEDVARQNDVTRIRRVTLQLGEVSGVVESYLQDCWKWAAAKSELLPGAVCYDAFSLKGSSCKCMANNLPAPAGGHAPIVIGNETFSTSYL